MSKVNGQVFVYIAGMQLETKAVVQVFGSKSGMDAYVQEHIEAGTGTPLYSKAHQVAGADHLLEEADE